MSELAERHVLGMVLHDFSYMEDCTALEPDMFYGTNRKRVFNYLKQIFDTGKQYSLSMVEAKYSGEQEVITEIARCMESIIDIVMIKPDVEVVINSYRANEVYRMFKNTQLSPDKINDQIGNMVNKLEALVEGKALNCESVAEMAAHYSGDYFKEHETIELGFKKLDEHVGNMDRGDVTVLGARPSIGKSALSLQIGKNLIKQGKRVGIFNLEMHQKQVYERLIAAESQISLQRIRRAIKPLGNEAEDFASANERLKQLDNLYVTSGSKSVADIRNESRHMKYDVIIIDYLQLLKSGKRYSGNRAAEVGDISKSLKEMAMELGVHIIVLSQLNRTSKPDSEPSMNELRESGDIEQDASIIILMWLLSDGITRGWKVDKCRNGTLGSGAFDFDGSTMTFTETDFKPPDKKDKKDCPFS